MTNKKENSVISKVENTKENQTVNQENVGNILDGLDEDSEVPEVPEVPESSEKPQYSNIEWLTKNEPSFNESVSSSKYDPEREPKVQEGLKTIEVLTGKNINPLILLLGKWWEVKPARAAIKKLIDAEANAKGQAPDHYLQNDLRQNVDALASISQATDRLKYAITYFKPRGGLSTTEIYKSVSIRGEVYKVPMSKLPELKEKFADNKELLYDAIIAISEKVQIEEL